MIRSLLLFCLFTCTISCQEPAVHNSTKVTPAAPPPPELVKADSYTDFVQQDKKELAYEEAYRLENYLIAETPSSDFITVQEKAGLFISPDSDKIEQLKKELGEENFYTVADDNIYYEYEAAEFLKKHQVQVLHPNTRYIKFVAGAKSFTFDTRAKASGGWVAILFNPAQPAPRVINPVDIEEEYEEYMK